MIVGLAGYNWEWGIEIFRRIGDTFGPTQRRNET
jgi:hypothetical protein